MVFETATRRVTPLMILLLGAALAAFTAGGGPGSLDYEITAIKGKLLRESPEPESRLQVGELVSSGAVLRTGWRSSAELREASQKARFLLESRTRVQLAGNRPGVLLDVEKGKLRAIFDKLDGDEPVERIVTTPSAVLAVRGTEYGVQVKRSGDTTVVVFEGEVEVVDLDRRGAPVRVTAGTSCAIPRGRLPGAATPHTMTPGDWDRGRMPTTGAGRSGAEGAAGGAAATSGSRMGSGGGASRKGSGGR